MASRVAAHQSDAVSTEWISEVESVLLENVGCRFDLWFRDVAGWKPIHGDKAESTSCSNEPRIDTSILEKAREADGEPVIAGTDDGPQWLVIAIPQGKDRDLIAAAPARGAEAETLQRLARLAIQNLTHRDRLKRLSDENTAFAKQVTDDFEELIFLRQIAEYIEISNVSQDFLQLTESVLPLLVPTLKAKAVAYVEDRSRTERPEDPAIGHVVVHGENGDHDDEVCRHLVRLHHRDALHGPIVRNGVAAEKTVSEYPEVTAYVVVQVAKDDRHYGWLVSLNRAPGYGYEVDTARWLTSDLEYGTSEATLMITAASVLATQARNMELFREKEQLLTSVVRALVSAIEERDNYTCGHSERVAAMGRQLARRVGLDEKACDRIYLAGLLHDVGKIGVSDATLRKPSRLTDAEMAEIQRHPDSGWAILHELRQLAYILPGVLFHHERYDGKGYPDGLAGEDIPVDGRILAVADAYDAMTSDRPYRTSMPQGKAQAILEQGANQQWDPVLIKAFVESMPEMIEICDNYVQRAHAKRRHKSIHVESGDAEDAE